MFDSSSNEEERYLAVDDVRDDASSDSNGVEIGLAGYVARLKGHSPMLTKMAEDEWKRKVAGRERFEGLSSA